MSTWWTPARRADIGLTGDDLQIPPIIVTNRGWRALYTTLTTLGGRHVRVIGDPAPFVPTPLAQHWGELLVTETVDLVQLGRFDGRAVTYAGIIRPEQADRFADTYELAPLVATPVGLWLSLVGQMLASTPTGLAITGRPDLRGARMTGVSLSKGGNVSLSKQAPNLTAVIVGLGWDARTTTGLDFDLDASALLCGANGKVVSDRHFVFFNNRTSPEGSVEHTGDNLTGTGTGDDERIKVNLTAVPAEVTRIVFPVSIYEPEQRNQNFGQVNNAFIRIINQADNSELARYDLSEDAATETAMIFGELYRHNDEWKFRAVGQGYANGLAGIARDFGVNV